ncbi:MAG: sulfatase-like hydrolase/transferase [Fuerstiella sp.]|nr:sulfatase-like hydrolase/transferase [Fuerstiella sp.]MCP4507198.1 sulfatase-like hydrolase/transferase [Fuerstiella sp.]MDG2126878.1 sulfatase-like hydrolase/transferase [Fuerstiella sp.]
MFVILLFAAFPLCAADRPNVVMILADDQAYRDFGFMGNDLVHTPNIDRLAAESARYPNGYVPMSVCRPSLATLLTGLYPHQHGIHFNHPPPGLSVMRKTMTAAQYEQTRATTNRLIENVPTLPRILAEHGYACLQTGKHWEGSFRTAGFTHGMTLGRPASQLGAVTGTRLQSNDDWVAHGNGDAGLTIGRETMQPIYDFVDEQAPRKPFFVWYAPFLPHTPFDAAQRYHDVYKGKQIPEHMKPYYAEIARFDETVGSLAQYLDDRKLLDNTLIIFASDNGFRPHKTKREAYNSRSKLSEFEDGLRTPILVRWNEHVNPAEHSQLVHTVDLVPTILSAAGLSDAITPRMKGISLLPSATGREQLRHRPVFGAIYPNDAQVLDNPSLHVRGRWIRAGRFKLLVPGPAAKPVTLSLFDLKNDPRETMNLAAVSEYASCVEHMHQLLDQWWPLDDINHDINHDIKP